MNVIVDETGPFRVELDYEEDDDFIHSNYGSFCELPSRDQLDGDPKNSPDCGVFHVRNPGAWRKRVSPVLMTETWERGDLSVYGWFALAEHPKWEVADLVRGGMSEEDAWRKVLARWEGIIQRLANNEIVSMYLKAEVYWNDELIGEEAIGGVEARCFPDGKGAIDLAREHGIIEAAMAEAQKHIEKHCKSAKEKRQCQK